MSIDKLDLRDLAILLDVDGTILDIAPTPHGVHVPPTLRQTLADVWKRAGGALALVSGRPVADLDLIFSPLVLPAVGGHGAEFRPDVGRPVQRDRAPQLNGALKMQLCEIAKRYDGVGVEDKGYSVALHYRLVLAEKGLEVVEAVFKACQEFPADSYELLTGKAVLEVKSVGFHKGTGVRELMKHPPFAGRTPIFIGDDVTDEHAFEVMPEFNGHAISVGRRVPGVEARFQSPSDVRRWLEHISREPMMIPARVEVPA